jgi:hypothetical protein
MMIFKFRPVQFHQYSAIFKKNGRFFNAAMQAAAAGRLLMRNSTRLSRDNDKTMLPDNSPLTVMEILAV